jgi:histone H3/H4
MGKYAKLAKALAKERMRLKRAQIIGRFSLESKRIQSDSEIEGMPKFMKQLEIVKNSSIRKLMLRSCVKKATKPTYDAAKAELMDFMAGVLKDANLYRESAERKTIMKVDIDAALERRGLKVYG